MNREPCGIPEQPPSARGDGSSGCHARPIAIVPVRLGSAAWDPPNEAALPDATASKLQAQLVGLGACRDVIGLSAPVVSPAGSWAGAAGVDAASTAIKPTSAFAIADITKTFVAAEVLLLASGGEIDLQAVVGHPGEYMQYSSLLLVWPGTRTTVAVLVPAPGKTLDHTLVDCAMTLYQQLPRG